MQYKVPQNIDQEDKILGPLTFIQFIYVLIGGAIVILSLAIFDTALFLIIAIPTIILTVCFALLKVQDQPFSRFFVSFIVYLTQPKRRIWEDAEVDLNEKIQAATKAAEQKKHTLRKSKDIAPAAAGANANTASNATRGTVTPATPKRRLDTIGITKPVIMPGTIKPVVDPVPQHSAAPASAPQASYVPPVSYSNGVRVQNSTTTNGAKTITITLPEGQ